MTHVKSHPIDAATFAPLAYNGDDPVRAFESCFKIKIPRKMRPEITQAFHEAVANPGNFLKPEDVWDRFKKTYIQPEDSEAVYITHDTHVFGDGSKFVSVNVIENDQTRVKSGNGETFSEAVAEAFSLTGRQITREHGVIDAPGYGRKACAIVGVAQDDGKIYFGVGISEQHRTAEIMAATRACGRALYAAQGKTEAYTPKG